MKKYKILNYIKKRGAATHGAALKREGGFSPPCKLTIKAPHQLHGLHKRLSRQSPNR